MQAAGWLVPSGRDDSWRMSVHRPLIGGLRPHGQ